SNYAGWLVTSFCLLLALQLIDARLQRRVEKPAGVANLPYRSLLGPILYLSVIIFNLTMTVLIGERLLAITGVFVYTLPVLIVSVLVIRRANRHTKEEYAEHLRDFPASPVAGRR
ncbi:MAG TPA: carotenoid biosynthesis protein, partial [Geobacteraceae bacterium]